MDPIQVIIEQLAQCGSKDATGRFQIDLAQARQRLADFRLEDQQLWLLPTLQLGHSWEAARVEVRFLRNSVKVAILGCQQRVDLSPWLSQVGHLGIWRHSRLGPLVMACEVAAPPSGQDIAVRFQVGADATAGGVAFAVGSAGGVPSPILIRLIQ